ncbi:MAG: CTB family bacteriocin [Rivularia sp. (in: Bacteria)]|nr:CTB family bacteriocin [Rivularia sp. MS3]MBV6622757.1 CTB family bacteriocin [Rivularia sp. MS3]
MSISSIKESALFASLSEEEQEIISGGNVGFNFPQNFGGDFGLSETSYLQNVSALNTMSASGPQGSVAGGSSIEQLLKTNGVNALGFGK